MTGLWVTIAFIFGVMVGIGGTVWFFKRFLKRKAQKLVSNGISWLTVPDSKDEDNLDVTLANTEGGTEVIKGLMRMWKG